MVIGRYEKREMIPLEDFLIYECGGNKTKCAKMFSLTRSTVRDNASSYMVMIIENGYQLIKLGCKSQSVL